MAVEKTKHQFVDDNPYLVYSGEPESTVDSAGGGGGGGDDVLHVQIDQPVTTWSKDGTSLTTNVEPLAVYNAIMHRNVFITAPVSDNNQIQLVFILKKVIPNESAVLFSYREPKNALEYTIEIAPETGFTGNSPQQV